MNKYQMVHTIGELFKKCDSPADGLNEIARLLATTLNAWCSLYFYNSQSQQLTLVAAYGANGPYAGQAAFSVNSGLVGLSIRKNSIINLDDAQTHPEYHPSADFEDTPETAPHGALVVPLDTGNRRIIGALVLSRRQKAAFSPKIVGLVQEIALPLALFIINNELMRNTPADGHFSLKGAESDADTWPEAVLAGTPITGGVVFGNAVLISGVNDLLEAESEVPLADPDAVAAERRLLSDAQETVRSTCMKTAEELSTTLAEADCNIFEMHAMMVDDPTLQNTILGFIDKGHSLTSALAATLRVFSDKYSKIQDGTLRERLYDIKDVLLNLKNAADNIRGAESGKRETSFAPKNAVIVAKELLPSQLVSFPLKKLAGIVCEEGGATSHAAILARALQVTMLVGAPGIFSKVRSGDGILLDCDAAKCILRPSMSILRTYSAPLKLHRERKAQAGARQAKKPVRTELADGQPVTFASNLALLCEIPTNHFYGIGEIGLYRTEFMFMLKSDLPSEGEQFAHFRRIIESSNNLPITIRLLDAGGDKPIPYLDCWQKEQNPALGWRGLRFLLSNPEILQPHLRAILRATVYGKVSILVPMVADLYDLMQIKEALANAENALREQGIPYAADYKLGIMLEIPSAFFALEQMLPHINFVSIGTNDLVQFLFAVDRGNQQVRRWYRQCNPIVLKIIHDACELVRRYPNKSISLCGEVAGIRRMLPVLIGAGLRRFSINPSRIPALRDVAAKHTVLQCEALYEEIMRTCHTEMDVIGLLNRRGID